MKRKTSIFKSNLNAVGFMVHLLFSADLAEKLCSKNIYINSNSALKLWSPFSGETLMILFICTVILMQWFDITHYPQTKPMPPPSPSTQPHIHTHYCCLNYDSDILLPIHRFFATLACLDLQLPAFLSFPIPASVIRSMSFPGVGLWPACL